MRRALVTGATGGLGLALVRALVDAGYAVRATGRDQAVFERLAAMGEVEVVSADLTDPAAAARLCDGIDAVFHAAALSSPWGPYKRFHAINVTATERLLEAARAADADSFVYVSSPSVYARPADQVALTEAVPPAPRPMNAYAATKLLGEQKVLAANAPGFATCAIRPRALIGPDDRVLLPRLIRLVNGGRFPLLRGGRALVEPTDVRDAARALVLADQHRARAAGLAINVSGGRPVRVRDLALLLAGALGRDVRLVSVPLSLVTFAAMLSEAVCRILPGQPEPALTPYSVAALAYSQTFDLSLAAERLDWRPAFDPVESAVAVARAWAAEGGSA